MNEKGPIRANITQTVPYFSVGNMEQSIHFYVEQLGFKITNQWIPRGKIEWCWLQRGGGALMLQTFNAGSVWEGKRGEGVAIFFQCEDAIALYNEFIDNQVKAFEPFVGNGLWDLKVIDPDGYHLHFESVTDVPEETMYSEWAKNK